MNSNFWLESYRSSVRSYTSLPTKTDVLIIGGGLAGLTTAIILTTMKQYNVMVLDQNIVGLGNSSRGAGIFSLKIPKAKITSEDYTNIIHHATEGLKYFHELITVNKMACEASFSGSMHIAMSKREDDLYQKIAHYFANDYTYYPPNKVVHLTLSGLQSHGGLFVPHGFNCHPYALVDICSKLALNAGQQVVSHLRVTKVLNNDGELEVHTDQGHVIQPKYVVYCTNSIPSWISSPTNIILQKNYTLVSKRFDNITFSSLPQLWHYENNFLSCFSSRLIASCVTRDNNFSNFVLKQHYINQIMNKIKEKLPSEILQLPGFSLKPEFVHASIHNETTDRLPVVGPVIGRKNEFFNLAYARNSQCFIPTAAINIAGLISQNKHFLARYCSSISSERLS